MNIACIVVGKRLIDREEYDFTVRIRDVGITGHLEARDARATPVASIGVIYVEETVRRIVWMKS